LFKGIHTRSFAPVNNKSLKEEDDIIFHFQLFVVVPLKMGQPRPRSRQDTTDG